jgi:hypothetical protein
MCLKVLSEGEYDTDVGCSLLPTFSTTRPPTITSRSTDTLRTLEKGLGALRKTGGLTTDSEQSIRQRSFPSATSWGWCQLVFHTGLQYSTTREDTRGYDQRQRRGTTTALRLDIVLLAPNLAICKLKCGRAGEWVTSKKCSRWTTEIQSSYSSMESPREVS